MADGDSSAGRTELGSAVLDGIIIGVGLPAGTFLHICEVTYLTVCDLNIILLYFTDRSGGLKYIFTDISMVASEQ